MKIVVLGAAIVWGASLGCAETKVGLGEDCIKDTDCLSGVCAAQLCTDPGTDFSDAGAFDASGDGG